MKNLIFIACLIASLQGCTFEKSSEIIPVINIYGNLYNDFHKEHSRNVSLKTLPPDSKISFFSQGGITANGTVLNYNGAFWEGDLNKNWNPDYSQARITAYYPPLQDNGQNLYDTNGRLNDILYDSQDSPAGENIRLSFKHLFSSVKFKIVSELNKRIKEISFKTSTTIDRIIPETSEIQYDTETKNIPVIFTQQENGTYTVIVPPATQMYIDIQIQTTDGKAYQIQSATADFRPGYIYECQIRYDDGTAGIYSATDFLAFTHLINGEKYENRELTEFGTTQNGITTYKLKNDIYFTPEICEQLKEIGWWRDMDYNAPFNDIFDGQNFTLYNLDLTVASKKVSNGLFGSTGDEAQIKNLHLSNVKLTDSNTYDHYTGVLVGFNRGLIINCNLDSCSINATNLKKTHVGGIVGLNKGKIINCGLEYFNLNTAVVDAGGITFSNDGGIILNSYVANSNLKKAKDSGTLCYSCKQKAVVYNCYVFNSTAKVNRLCYFVESSTSEIKYCYYPKSVKKPVASYDNSQSQKNSILPYTTQTMTLADGAPVVDHLNQWITEFGDTKYPDYTFLKWKKSAALPPIILVRP